MSLAKLYLQVNPNSAVSRKTPKLMRILTVVGTRPNFVKIAPLLDEMSRHPDIEAILVHTGQHYDYEMSRAFFEDLEIPAPH